MMMNPVVSQPVWPGLVVVPIEAAATKIQAAFRGHQVRKGTTMKQGDVNGSEAGQQQNSAETEREPTKAELEAEFDPNDEELTQAATRIQACFRGHMARKEPEAEAEADKKGEGDKKEVDIDDLTRRSPKSSTSTWTIRSCTRRLAKFKPRSVATKPASRRASRTASRHPTLARTEINAAYT
ncbi:hypothetical protein quinque_007815 [Culex quinquefasciatus]